MGLCLLRATGIPMDTTIFENNQLTVIFKQGGVKYVASVESSKLKGTFYQGGMELPLEMEKSEKTIPGNPTLVSSDKTLEEIAGLDQGDYKYSVEDYFARPKARSFQFSPNGKYLSYREKTDKVTRVIEEKEELIRGYGWANNERLVYVMDKGGNEDYHLFAANIDGTDQKELTPYEGVQVNILEGLKEDENHMIISMNKNNKQIFEPYKINITLSQGMILIKMETLEDMVKYEMA